MSDAGHLPRVHTFLQHLSRLLATATLYSPRHGRTAAGVAAVVDSLQQLLAGEEELTLIVAEGDLLYQGKPLVRGPHVARIAGLLAGRGVGHIRFLAAADAADLRRLVRCLCGEEDMAALATGQTGIRVGAVDPAADAMIDDGLPIATFAEVPPARLKELQRFYDGIGSESRIDTRAVVTLVAGFVAAFRRTANPLLALVPLRRIDDYTFTHSINVGILNIAQGMSLGIEGQLLHDLGVAGMLHDCGKIFVDREIILKSGQLTEAEWLAIKTHPGQGARYLLAQKGLPAIAAISAFEHHLRYDLAGYPAVPAGWSLNLCSQMTMVSDTFDALRTCRVYKDSWDFPRVSARMLEVAGAQLNPDLTLNFLKLLAEMGETLPPSADDDPAPARSNYCE